MTLDQPKQEQHLQRAAFAAHTHSFQTVNQPHPTTVITIAPLFDTTAIFKTSLQLSFWSPSEPPKTNSPSVQRSSKARPLPAFAQHLHLYTSALNWSDLQDVQELPCVGIPHFEEMIVDSSNDRVVMAIPWHHGDLGFEKALFFCWRPRAAERKHTEVNSTELRVKERRESEMMWRRLYPGSTEDMSSKILLHWCFWSSRQIRAVPSRLPLTNLTDRQTDKGCYGTMTCTVITHLYSNQLTNNIGQFWHVSLVLTCA